MNTIHDITSFATSSAEPYVKKPGTGRAENGSLIEALNIALANVIDVESRNQQAFWSAKGNSFYALHKMFEDFGKDLDVVATQLASRIMALGGTPLWTLQAVSKLSKLPPYPATAPQALDHLESLVASYEAAGKQIPLAMKKAMQFGDHATASVLSSCTRTLDAQASFIAAHIPQGWQPAREKRTAS